MKKIAILVFVSILLVSALVGCDGDGTPTSHPPIILSVVTATPSFVGPQPDASATPGGSQVQPSPGATH